MPLTPQTIRCECGFEAVATTDDELVTVAQAHSRAAHGVEVEADLVLALARPQRPAPKPEPGR